MVCPSPNAVRPFSTTMDNTHGSQIWQPPIHFKTQVSSPFIGKAKQVDSRRGHTDSDSTEYLYDGGLVDSDTATGDDFGYDLPADDDAYADCGDGSLDIE